MLDLLNKLNSCHGPAGDEREISQYISKLIAPHVDEVYSDVMGNLIAHKRGTGSKIMICAHMDSIGLIVTHIEKEGFLRVGALGGIYPSKILYTPVRFKNGVTGAIIKDDKADIGKLKTSDLLIDIGAKDETDAKRKIQLGDTAVFDLPARQVIDSKVISPYMDNRISCGILIQAIQQLEGCENDMYFVFSAQEEVGLRGATTAAYAIAPDYGIALDVTSASDVPGFDHGATAKLGGGGAIKIMDRSIICHPQMIAQLEALTQEKNIKSQRDIINAGGTDAGAISKSRYGVISGGISVPCRYIHSPAEMIDLDDVDCCVQLVKAVANAKFQ